MRLTTQELLEKREGASEVERAYIDEIILLREALASVKVINLTPGGEISAIADGDEYYPNINLYASGVLRVSLEYDSDYEQLRTHVWDEEQDEPIFSYPQK
jgi:hypothetical protein